MAKMLVEFEWNEDGPLKWLNETSLGQLLYSPLQVNRELLAFTMKSPAPAKARSSAIPLSDQACEALELCGSILSLIGDLPEAAEDFASSIEEKTSDIQAWIKEHGHCTDRQIEALENMQAGCERWLS